MSWARRVSKLLTGRVDLGLACVRADWVMAPCNGPELVVRGRERHDVPALLFSTSYWGELEPTVLQVLGHLVAPTGKVVSRRRIVGELSVAEFEAQGERDRESSLQAALLAAGEILGLPGRVRGRGVVVEDVDPEGASALAVRRGDLIVAVEGEMVESLLEALPLLEGREEARVQVRPALSGSGSGEEESRVLRRGKHGAWGVQVRTLEQRVESPLDVSVEWDAQSGGPSTGLMLGLSILDVLTPGSITGGLTVAGTGALEADGKVREVGGVRWKARTVRDLKPGLFLVPRENEDEARKGAGSVPVVGVTSLREAVDALVERGGVRPSLRDLSNPQEEA